MYSVGENVGLFGLARTDLKVGTCGWSMYPAWEPRPVFSGHNGAMVRGALLSKGHPVPPLDVFGCSIHLNHRPGLDSVRVGYVICSIDGPGFAGGRPAAIRCGEGRRPSKHASIHRISIRRLPMVPLLPNVV